MLKIGFLALVGVATATIGFDTVQPVSSGVYSCLGEKGYAFFIARVWKSTGNFDETGITNIKNAQAAGWKSVDGYIFPCLASTCATPEAQVEAAVQRLRAEGANVGMIWLDIERLSWPADHSHNRDFITRMGNQLNSMNINYGVYTDVDNWNAVVGLDWTGMGSRPLWWASRNGRMDYGLFQPFGGWSQPAIHQYIGNYKSPCGIDLDLNWHPS